MGRSRKVVHASEVTWDETYDVVVVGAGAAGLPAALFAARKGSSVVVLEKASHPGGTMLKSAAWYWIPNNRYMREDGKPDDKDAFLRYAARLARPQRYDPSDARLGMTEWEYGTLSVLYDNADTANETLAEMGAIKPLYSPAIPDYHSWLPEATVPHGRTLQVDRGDGEMGKGDVLTGYLVEACEKLSIPILCDQRVETVVVDEDGAVVGVRVANGDGVQHINARQGVVFATGGFTHSDELRKNFLPAVILSGCAAPSNEGDFVHIATALGLPLRNMNFAWMAPIPLELALAGSPEMSGIFSVPGDSMIWVDKYGRRVVNEKTIYNDLAMSFLEFDGRKMEYPRLLMFMIWDQRTMEAWTPDTGGSPPGPHLQLANYGNVVYEDFHLIKGETLDDLCTSIEARLDKYASQTGGFRLDASFRENLPKSVARWNEFAPTGKDPDLGRGENPIELIFNGPAKDDNDTGNPTMYPISEQGPYYATIICAGTLDTKGGPVTNTNGQVLDADGRPVAGLYAVGNCAANATGQAYLAGGGTIGPFITFAYLTAEDVTQQPRREVGVAVG
jgi:succinate dehydrogenase/fumarate reductase flavoprotein subunit